MGYKLANLNIYDHRNSRRAGEILIQHGETEDESDLLIVVETEDNILEHKKFINNFLTLAFEAYDKAKIFETEKGLEKILHELNAKLPDFFPKKNFTGKFHCFIGLYRRGFFYFTTLNEINVYLVKNASITKINQPLPPEDINQSHNLFSDTISGQIKDNDKVLVSTYSLTDYLSLEKIKKTIATLPPSSSIAHLTNILQASPPQITFFAIIFTAPLVKETADPAMSVNKPIIAPNSKSSLDQLLKTQQETERILKKPSLFKGLQAKIEQSIGQAKNRRPAAPGINMGKKSNRTPLSFNYALGKIKKFFNLLFFMEDRKKLYANFFIEFTKLFKRFMKLPKFSRALLIVFFIVLLLLAQNLIWQSKKKDSLAENQAYLTQIQQLEEKQRSIEASLIYNDLTRARQLLAETNQLLDQLPQNSKNRIAKYQELKAGAQIIFNKIWKVTTVINPLILFDFTAINPDVQILKIALKDSAVYALNSTGQLYLYDIKTNQATVQTQQNLVLKNISLTPKNQLIGYTTEKQFYQINQNDLTPLSVNPLTASENINDLAFYLDKMYLLDREAKQIYRFSNVGNNYQNKRSWLKEDLPANQMISLAVDGFVYGLTETGTIIKMANGQKQDFPALIIEPQLTSPTKIVTASESDYLYILDPANQRFIKINKSGNEIAGQFYSEKFNDLKDLLVDEVNKKAYLLNGSQIIVVGL